MGRRLGAPPPDWGNLPRENGFAGIPLGTRVENWEFPDAIFVVTFIDMYEPKIMWVSGAKDVFRTYGKEWSPAVSWCRLVPWPSRLALPAGV